MSSSFQLDEGDIESIANRLSLGAELVLFHKGNYYSWVRCDEIFIMGQFEKKTDIFSGLRDAQKLTAILKRVFGFVSDQLVAQNFIGVTMVR